MTEISYKSSLDDAFEVLVVYKESTLYDSLLEAFSRSGLAFLIPEKQIIVVNGEDLKSLTCEHLLMVEAHEIAHFRLSHSAPFTKEKEIEADLEGINILKENGFLKASKMFQKLSEGRHV